MKKVAMLRSLLDEFCGSGGLSELDFAADKRGKTLAVLLSAIGLILIGQLRPFAACAKVSFTASTILLPTLSASMSLALCSRRGVGLTLDRVVACATPRGRAVLRRAGWTVRARLFSPARGWCFAGL
jgi:hypothetical protein